ncbi:lipoprotein [Streptomyces laurentii]|uniref:Lipoprotein n=1 Tax=Streptomyces laurentii TaxID=39478 RepID=A0A160NY27_STRLU|nr:lipoprotein [Streptomyces laurentii]
MPLTPRPRSRRLALAAGALCTAALALGATACGPGSGSGSGSGAAAKETPKATGPFGDMTGTAIADKAFAATRDAGSLTMDVSMHLSDGRVKAKISTDHEGRCAGTVQDGGAGAADLIRTADKTSYVRFDERLIKEQVKGESADVQAAVMKELKGRWMKVDPKDPDLKDMVEVCELRQVLADFETSTAGTVKGGETTLDGRKALMLTQRDGSEKSTAYVATEGKPYLLKITVTGGKEPGSLTFSDYDKPVKAEAPAKKDMVDEAALG